MTKKSENNFQQSIQEIIILYKNNLVKEANLKSEKLLEDNQNSFFLLNLNGIINITLKNWEKAINSLNKALKEAKSEASSSDLIVVLGSFFLISDFY